MIIKKNIRVCDFCSDKNTLFIATKKCPVCDKDMCDAEAVDCYDEIEIEISGEYPDENLVLCRKCYDNFHTTQALFKRINKEIIAYLKDKKEKQELKKQKEKQKKNEQTQKSVDE